MMVRIADACRRLYGGCYYPIMVVVMALLGHCLEADILFIALILLSLVPPLLFCRDLRFAIAPYLCVYYTISTGDYRPSDISIERFLHPGTLILGGAIAILLLSAFAVFTRRNSPFANRIPKSSLLWSMLIFCCVLLTNGAFHGEYTPKNIAFVFTLIFPLLIGYFLFARYVRFDDTAFSYFLYCLLLAGLLISAELLFAYATTVQFEAGQIVKGSVVLGWGVWTNVGSLLAMLMPAAFYFAYSHRHGWIGFAIGLFEYFCIVLSQSRGALLVGTVALALCLLTLCVGGRNRRINRFLTAAILLFGAIILALFAKKLVVLVQGFLQTGFSDNGRIEIWKLGIQNFFERPIFGCGFYDSYQNDAWDVGVFPHLFHNTPIQLLSSAGMLGLLAYLWHRICTLRAVFARPSHKKIFLSIGILAFLLFNLIDVVFFLIYPTMFYALMLLFIENSEVTDADALR